MIGLGTWKFNVDTMFYKGEALLTIADEDGGYGINCELKEMDLGMQIVSVNEENGDTLSGTATISLLKGKEVEFSVTFAENAANGFLKVPFIGKIKLKDGEKV